MNAWANVRSDYIAATRPRSTKAPTPGYPSGAKSVRDCNLSGHGPINRTRTRIAAPVAVVTGRGTEALSGGKPTTKAMLKRDRKRRAARRNRSN